MLGKFRLAVLGVAILAAALVAGCGNSKNEKKSMPSVITPKIVADLQLGVNEKGSSFNKSKVVSSKPGTIKITVTNPANANGQHGVGIDGGAYKNIKGAPVKPGRSTSLTVDVKAGQYVIFDSYKNNRGKGYETTLTVKK